MLGIKSIIYEDNVTSLIINFGNKIEVTYKDVLEAVDKEVILNYLEVLYSIIGNWEEEYINTTLISHDYWNLTINFDNGTKKEYRGKSDYPTNFEAFERLNKSLINEVYNG